MFLITEIFIIFLEFLYPLIYVHFIEGDFICFLKYSHVTYTSISYEKWKKIMKFHVLFSSISQKLPFYTILYALCKVLSLFFKASYLQAGAHLGVGRGEYSPAQMFDLNFVPYFYLKCPILCPILTWFVPSFHEIITNR